MLCLVRDLIRLCSILIPCACMHIHAHAPYLGKFTFFLVLFSHFIYDLCLAAFADAHTTWGAYREAFENGDAPAASKCFAANASVSVWSHTSKEYVASCVIRIDRYLVSIIPLLRMCVCVCVCVCDK